MTRKISLRTADYARLAAFRYALRSFLHFSEAAASRAGLTGQQYQAMLYVRSRGEAPVSINDLATELLIRHNSAVGLTDRLVTQGLMVRERAVEDRRRVRLALTARGELLVGQVANVSRRKLKQAGPDIHRVVGELASVWERD
ncbi:MAG: MarR family winged helix-turn-helix transcriptional regulator [Usitatibacter sp.]